VALILRRANVSRKGDLMPRFPAPLVAMTLGNMRAQDVRSLSVTCWLCHHGAVFAVDRWPDDLPVPSFGPRMVCTAAE
jgi:hypothetical protein